MADIHLFFHLLFISVVALFPVVNPIGNSLIVSPYFTGLSKKEKNAAVRKIAFYTFVLGVLFLIGGHVILELFGITIPVIQLAGGIMICKTGWESLASDMATSQSAEPKTDLGITINANQNKLFYPLTFPITIGGGTISVLFTLGAHSDAANLTHYLINMGAVITAIIVICIVIFICYRNAESLFRYLGSDFENIVNRIMAFLLFCVGLQIAMSGIHTLFKL